MLRPTDQTDPDAPPPDELNPLVNPLLSQHMGRWAEVYFKSPPEKRDEAVQNLLRELRGETPVVHDKNSESAALVRTSVPDLETSAALTAERDVICAHCGHVNAPSQRFCGMCGVSLGLSAEERAFVPNESPHYDVPAPSVTTGGDMETQSESSHYFLDERPHPTYSDDDRPMFESVGPSFSYGYRVVIGLVLAIAIGALAYNAWRGNQNNMDATQASSQAPPVADQPAPPAAKSDSANQASASAEDNATPKKNEPVPAVAKNEAPAPVPAAKPAAPAPVTTASAKNVAEPAPRKTAARATDRSATRPETAATQAKPTSGAEELEMAERYLNTAPGQRRDPAQAAQWLWKSVAKQNPQATVLLADLYLRGDGIQKNCDQARVLLDAAARKGQTGASQRLRNMQAFGCQ